MNVDQDPIGHRLPTQPSRAKLSPRNGFSGSFHRLFAKPTSRQDGARALHRTFRVDEDHHSNCKAGTRTPTAPGFKSLRPGGARPVEFDVRLNELFGVVYRDQEPTAVTIPLPAANSLGSRNMARLCHRRICPKAEGQ